MAPWFSVCCRRSPPALPRRCRRCLSTMPATNASRRACRRASTASTPRRRSSHRSAG
uniref:Uncharacterized protein n=1 Tax=Arundo donax TaxID=35708 RepID=A0A0A9FG58_ARUDO